MLLRLLMDRLWSVLEAGQKSLLRGSPKGQSSPGRLYIVQEGNPKGTGAAHPHVMQAEPSGKMIGLSELQSLAGTQGGGKREGERVWPLGQAAQENHRDVMRLFRDKIRMDKVQLGLNMATAIKDNKDYFYKYMNLISS